MLEPSHLPEHAGGTGSNNRGVQHKRLGVDVELPLGRFLIGHHARVSRAAHREIFQWEMGACGRAHRSPAA